MRALVCTFFLGAVGRTKGYAVAEPKQGIAGGERYFRPSVSDDEEGQFGNCGASERAGICLCGRNSAVEISCSAVHRKIPVISGRSEFMSGQLCDILYFY